MLIFCDFIQVYVFTTNHHLKTSLLTCPDKVYGWYATYVVFGDNNGTCKCVNMQYGRAHTDLV